MDSLPWRFFRKLAMMQILVTAVVIIATAWLGRYYLKTYTVNQSISQLNQSLTLIKQSIIGQQISPIKWCQSLKKNWSTRYSLIDSTGKLLCDTHPDTNDSISLLSFPDVQDALRLGIGNYLVNLDNEETTVVYGAIAIDSVVNGLKQRFIIRQELPLTKLDSAMKELDQSIMLFLFPLLVLTSLLSLWGSLQISFPIRSVLKKIDKMNKISDQDLPSPQNKEGALLIGSDNNEWAIVERTLDRAKKGLEEHLEELHNENQKMTTVMESITDLILAVGLNDNILFANNHFRKNFMVKEVKKKELSKLKIYEVCHLDEVLDLFKQCLLTGESLKKRNLELPVKGGKRNGYFDIKVSPLFSLSGEIFGAAGVLHDVTESRLADQMREDFVANVSHEVRTPLTAMKGYVQIIKSLPSDKTTEIKNYLNKIEQNSDRLTALFNDILNLSVIESKQKTPKQTVDPKALTNTVIANVKQSHTEKNIRVEQDCQIDKVWADPLLLEQVLTNLIDNAIKYSNTECHIKVTWKKSEKERWSVLTVSDNGIGIAKEHLPRLFERFYRVDSGRSRMMGGTGLGLAIVKHIVQNHNGKISAESTLGKGTTFTVKLPAHY